MAEVLVSLIHKGKIKLDDIKDETMREKVRKILEEE